MNSAAFAPRTIAAARRVRSRFLAVQFRRWRRRIVATVIDGCAAVADVWRRHEELIDMLHFDDRLLRDIGMTRSDIVAAVQERQWTHATWRLVTTAIARRRKRRAAEARIRFAARTLLRLNPRVTSRPRVSNRDGAMQRRAA